MAKVEAFIGNHLDLPEFNIINRQESPSGVILYTVEPKEAPAKCPSCGGKLNIHKKVERKVKDLDEFGKQVGILVKGRSYICKTCGETVRVDYPSLHKQMTQRLAEHIMRDTFREGTFTEVAKKYHVSTSTAKELFEERGRERWAEYRLITPTVLGIDEVHLNNAYYGVFVRVDKQNGGIIELSEKRTKQAIIDVLERMDQPENLKFVTIDMWRPYADAVHSVFPEVPVVVDHFHVIKELTRSLDSVRSETCKRLSNVRERKSLKRNRFLLLSNHESLSPKDIKFLQELFDNYPQFKIPYDLKESFRNIYSLAKSREEAMQFFHEWCDECKRLKVTAFDKFIGMVYNWQQEIFAYFDYPDLDRTNAQTESFNRSIRNVARDGRGYSFENLRTKMIFREKTPDSTRFDFDAFLLMNDDDTDDE